MPRDVESFGERERTRIERFADDRALDKVIADVQSGQALGVTSTPTLFINDQNYFNPGTSDAIAAILRQVGR